MRKERKWAGGFSSKETLRFSVASGLAKCGGCLLLDLLLGVEHCISQITGCGLEMWTL